MHWRYIGLYVWNNIIQLYARPWQTLNGSFLYAYSFVVVVVVAVLFIVELTGVVKLCVYSSSFVLSLSVPPFKHPPLSLARARALVCPRSLTNTERCIHCVVNRQFVRIRNMKLWWKKIKQHNEEEAIVLLSTKDRVNFQFRNILSLFRAHSTLPRLLACYSWIACAHTTRINMIAQQWTGPFSRAQWLFSLNAICILLFLFHYSKNKLMARAVHRKIVRRTMSCIVERA